MLYAGSACAGDLAISPIRVELSPRAPTAAMKLRNFGKAPTLVQLTAVDWSIKGGESVHEPTRKIIATPPIFTIPPGEKQIVRLGLRHPEPAPVERSYRLIIQEVPSENPKDTGLQVALRISVPVFVAPSKAPEPALDWQAAFVGDQTVRIKAINTGNVHVKVSDIRVTAPAGEREWALGDGFAYLLPGTARHWTLETANVEQGDNLRLVADTDTEQEKIKVTLKLGAP